MYADDTSVTCSAEHIETLCDDWRTELTNNSEWMRQNKLSFNNFITVTIQLRITKKFLS